MDILLYGRASSLGLALPDAIDNFESARSIENNLTMKVRTKRFSPAGTHGELVWRRLVVVGYHRTFFQFIATPWVDGRELRELATFCTRPGPPEERETRFDILIPLYFDSLTYPGLRTGLRGTTAEIEVKITDPQGRFDLESLSILHEPIDDTRAKTVKE